MSVDPARWAVLPLRAFLGITFLFAGLQKLANPDFFNASNPASMQAQLAAASRRSPIHALVSPLVHVAIPVGVAIALAELAVGLGTVLGLGTRPAAAGGMAIALSLFLTVSFHASPYYTGSDIVFLFAWTPVLLAGPDPRVSLDAWIERRAFSPTTRSAEPPRVRHPTVDRRTVTRKGAWTAAAALGIVSAGLAAGVGRAASRRPGLSAGSTRGTAATVSPTTAAPSGRSSSTAGAPASKSTGPSPTAAPAATRPPGTRIGPARAVPVAGAAQFRDPGSGDPAFVVQPTPGRFLAFDAVCPHAGCIVGYDSGSGTFVCPCHGSEFSAETGAVQVGPAASGLTRIAISEGSDGQLYAR